MNKTAFIAGSTKGIGKEIGIDLLKLGYYVYFNGHTLESCRNLIKQLGNRYKNKHNIICQDLSTVSESLYLATGMQEVVNLDVLVWNVGLTDRTPFGKINPEEWNRVFEANVNAPFFFIQAMKDKINPNGKIILISSILGIVPDSVSISYGVSKAAINMLVPYLAKEFKDKKITVNAIAPGFVATDWHIGKSQEQIKRIEQKTLANRFATTEEISKVAQSIINNNYINGQVIRIDGGYGL